MFLWLRAVLRSWQQPPGTREQDIGRAIQELQRFRQLLALANEELRLTKHLVDVTEDELSKERERLKVRENTLTPQSFDHTYRQRSQASG